MQKVSLLRQQQTHITVWQSTGTAGCNGMSAYWHTAQGLTNELVLDIAARALGKYCALLPCVWVDHLGGSLATQIAGELHPLCSARVCCRWPYDIIRVILRRLASCVSC